MDTPRPKLSKPPAELEILTRLDLYFSVRHTARTFRMFGEIFDHDYDKVAIFLSVAEVCFQSAFHLAPIENSPVDIERVYSEVATSGLSIMTIGEITGIPRETVRRKVKSLVDDKHLAANTDTNTIYLPASVVISQRFLPIFNSHLADAAQFVKAVKFYHKPD